MDLGVEIVDRGLVAIDGLFLLLELFREVRDLLLQVVIIGVLFSRLTFSALDAFADDLVELFLCFDYSKFCHFFVPFPLSGRYP